MADEGRREKDLDLVEEFNTVRAITKDGRSVQVPKSKFGGNLEVASDNVLGGIKASPKSETDTNEVKIDPNTGKLYCPPSEVSIATSDKLGGIVASAKTSKETVEVKIDSATGKLYVPEGEGNPPDEEDITLANIDGVDKLQFNDKQYDASSYSGMGRKYLRKNMVSGVNVLTQDMFVDSDGNSKTNTRYIVQYDYDLSGSTITVPSGCVLEFQGGSFKNGTIKGDNTFISSIGDTAIFGNSLTIAGSFKNEYAVLTWWGAKDSCESWSLKNYDVSGCFELFMASPFRKLYIPKGYWYIGKTVEFTRQFALKMAGDVGEITEIESAMVMKRPNDHAVVYTDLDITVFRIKSNAGTTVAWSYVSDIIGGIVDVSNCRNYTSNAIEYIVSNGLAIGGGKIATTLVGYSDTSLLSKNNSAICLIGYGSVASFVWNLEFRSAIAGFTKAVYVKDGGRTNNYTVWINGLMDYNRTAKCCQSFVSDFGDYNVIAGEYQSGGYFTASNYKNYAQVAIGGLNNKFDGRVWDFRGTFNGMQSNYYALELLPSSSNTDVSKVIQGLYPDAVKNYTNDVYGKYNASLGKFGYEDIENFFIDNPYLNIETECVGCSITSTYNSPKQLLRPYNKKVLTFTITEDTATAKIILNIADKDSWGGRFRLLLAGITLSTYKASYFSKVTFNYYVNDSLVHTEEKVVMPTSGFTFDRIYSSLETLYKYSTINKVEFLLSDFIYTAASKTVDVVEIFGKVDNQPVPWMLSSAGGEFYGTFYKNGKTYMNNKVYDGLNSLPSTAANGAIMDVSGQMAMRDSGGWGYLSKDLSGTTSARPSVKHAGMCYFDSTMNKPIWWNGSKWVDATGATV